MGFIAYAPGIWSISRHDPSSIAYPTAPRHSLSGTAEFFQIPQVPRTYPEGQAKFCWHILLDNSSPSFINPLTQFLTRTVREINRLKILWDIPCTSHGIKVEVSWDVLLEVRLKSMAFPIELVNYPNCLHHRHLPWDIPFEAITRRIRFPH